MSENPYTKKSPEVYEEYTQAEKGAICPFLDEPCVKDPQFCRFWQPFLVVRQSVLNTPVYEDIYMCSFDSLRVALNNALLMLQGQQAVFQMVAQNEAPGAQGEMQQGKQGN